MSYLHLDASEVPRVYKFKVMVNGEPYGEVTQLLLDHEIPAIEEKIEEAVRDVLSDTDTIDIERYAL
jgi:hypothetical protein